MTGSRLVVVQIVALALVGAVTAARFHVFAAVDEKQHYAYAQSIARDRRVPVITDPVTAGTQRIAGAGAVGDELADRQYEAFQPPLYYALAAPLAALGGDDRGTVFLLRFLGWALLLATVGVLWALARAVRPGSAPLALAGGLVVLLWPGVVSRAVTVSPTPLELLLVPALLLAAYRRALVWLGVLTGLVLLTRLTLVYLLPVFALALWQARHDRRGVVLAVVIPLVMLAPWLIVNHDRYGSFTAAAQARDQQRAYVAPEASYDGADVWRFTRRLFDNVLATEQSKQLSVWWVRIASTGLLLALLAVALTRDRPTLRFALPVLAGYLLMVHVLLAQTWPSFNLRYLYPVLPPLAVVAVGRLGPRAWIGVAACLVVLAALWIDVAGAFFFTDIGDKLGI